MSESNKSYRVHTSINNPSNTFLNIDVPLLQDYDIFEILSLKIGTEGLYKLHTSKYGCMVGRVLANGGVGVPNVKISVFTPIDDVDSQSPIYSYLYPYKNTYTRNEDGIRYNLLPEEKTNECHQPVGTFPSKRMVLDDENEIEIFDKYFKYTTTTNSSGDYMILGLPTGNNIIHSDLDLSDIGLLSQKPRDLYYKGYNVKQFENASKFKKDTNLDNLTQIISQNSSVYVYPFWGDDEEDSNQVKITRHDIQVDYKFEPTCIFIGCIVSDEKSHGISKNCIPHERMGKMDRLTTGRGTIEMIRKTIRGDVESVTIQGNDLIDGNGTWCYQIPMNLDYVITNEEGELVHTDNTDKGLPTRADVRFRISLADYESDYESSHLVKMLVPNTKNDSNSYEFGTKTDDGDFRTLFWNNVYTVKSFIPRFQKGNVSRNKNFTGFKTVNVNGGNNPIPYNNMRVNFTFLFIFQCIIFKSVIMIVKLLNKIIHFLNKITSDNDCKSQDGQSHLVYITIDGALCPELDGNYMAPGAIDNDNEKDVQLIRNTYAAIYGDNLTIMERSGSTNGSITIQDKQSSDVKNRQDINNQNYFNSGDTKEVIRIYKTEDYFVKCVELQFAKEYEVIQFDFYNDWINGMLYIPRWFAEIRNSKDKTYYCGENYNRLGVRKRYYTQQCAIGYNTGDTKINQYFPLGCVKDHELNNCAERPSGRKQVKILLPKEDGTKRGGGIVERKETIYGQYVYYFRPIDKYLYEGNDTTGFTNLFKTDIVLLGSTEECNQYGIPEAKGYSSSTYRMPPATGQLLDDSQEIEINPTDSQPTDVTGDTRNYKLFEFKKSKKSRNKNATGDTTQIEISGIDWGYNPFFSGEKDNTRYVDAQVAGHFLEIGCTFSMTNIKTCVNLQRVCELGAEFSQSHYYASNDKSTYLSATGIISKREVVDNNMRSIFATLNSNNLETEYDENGFLKYKFTNYYPSSFSGDFKEHWNMGNLINETEDAEYYMVDSISDSYNRFRFGDSGGTFLIKEEYEDENENETEMRFLPKYNNSFYFYFGLKDGSTAIDRLYNEYFADCN